MILAGHLTIAALASTCMCLVFQTLREPLAGGALAEKRRLACLFRKFKGGIGVAETALKDAGPDQAINAIIDALKEIARTLGDQKNPSKNRSTENTSPRTPPVSMASEDRGRRFNFEKD